MTIRQLQALLDYLGYSPGEVDGISGPNTAAALKSFQAAAGLTADGIPGSQTWVALKEAVAGDCFAPMDSAESERPGSRPAGDFWGDIRYFTREEFRCKCGGKHCGGFPAEPEEKLVRLAERMREHFGRPVTVSSGLRCPSHNAAVGGVANSRHLSGKAMDFCVSGYSAEKVLAFVRSQPDIRYAYAINQNFVHMDVT